MLLMFSIARSPTWHVGIDFGSVGRVAVMYLKNGLEARMTMTAGRLHSFLSCWSDAVKDAGASLIRVECKALGELRFGPFSRQENHGIMLDMAQELCRVAPGDSPFFDALR